jgi:hypothetical protein
MGKSHILDVYGTRLEMVTTKREWKQLAKTLPVLANDHPQGAAGQVSCFTRTRKRELPQLVVVIWINLKAHGDDIPALVDTLGHEASHAAGRILEHAGHQVDGTDEPHAYLCGWLTRWAYEGCV